MNDYVLEMDDYIVSSEVNTMIRSVSASDATGLKATVLSLIGDYDSVVTDYTYTTYNGSVQHSIDVQPDYAWIISACLFALCLFSAFRFLGGLFKGGGYRV